MQYPAILHSQPWLSTLDSMHAYMLHTVRYIATGSCNVLLYTQHVHVHVTLVQLDLELSKNWYVESIIIGILYDKDTLAQQTYRYSMAIQRVGMTTAHAQLV